MKTAHLTTVDMSLWYLVLPQLIAAQQLGEVIGISAPGSFVPDLEAKGVRHIPLGASTRGVSPLSDLRAAVQFWRILRREKIDILHTHNPKPGVYGRILGRLAGVPIVVNTVHGLYATADSPLLMRAVVYGLEMLSSRFSDAELIQNPEDFDLMWRFRMAPRSRMRLLGNGVDLERFTPASEESRRRARAAVGVDDDRVVVGMVGRLVAEKGIPELIEAAEVIGDGYAFIVVGPDDPEKADALPRETLDRGVAAGVRFLGMRSDVADLYHAFDIFVLPSHREGFPRAAMEAAASGIPVIASDIRGCRQVVESGTNGFLVPVSDSVRLAEAIVRLGEDPAMRSSFGEASHRRAQAMFDEARVVETVIETYERAARRKGLAWQVVGVADPVVRSASGSDAPAIARLHQRLIPSGFLSSLGHRFLRLLYRDLIADSTAEVFVADSGGDVVGFIAGVGDTGAFYRRFIRRNWLHAGILLLPVLLRPERLRRVVETLRQGGSSHGQAELVSMAVAPAARGRGMGGKLIRSLLDRARSTGITRMKVVVGSENRVAIHLYETAGFSLSRRLEVHRGWASQEMTWHSQDF